MARATRRIKPIRIWIPPAYTAKHKLTVTRQDGTIDDLTSIAFFIEINDGVTDLIGDFKFKIWNPNEKYTKVWTGMEVVKYYCDYDSTATTLRFRGRVEKPLYRNNMQIEVSGRSEALLYMEESITASFVEVDCAEILKSIIAQKAISGFTVTNIETTGVLKSFDWSEKPFWEAVQEICKASGNDCYIDANKDWHLFKVGSRENNGEGIMYNYNLLDVGEFGDDLKVMKNKVRVMGSVNEGIQTLYTANDFASQTTYGIRVHTIQDDNITTLEAAKTVGDYWLSELKDPFTVGDVTGTLLASIQPGQKIWIGSPQNNLNQGKYNIQSYKHIINFDRGLTTEVAVEKEPRRITHVFQAFASTDSYSQNASLNPFEMDQSYNHTYNTDSGTHTNTEIIDSILRLKVGQSSGNWVSTKQTATNDLSEAYILAVGETLTGATFWVSADDGLNYVEIQNKERGVITQTGKSVRIKVVFSSADTQINSLAVMYK